MISFDARKLLTVPLSEVRPNPWNPKNENTAEYRKIKDSIERDGQKVPVVVRDNPGVTPYEIIDGQQRFDALIELGADDILIYNEGEVSDADAKNQTLWYQLQVPFDTTLQAALVAELAELGLPLPYEDDNIAELIKLHDLDLEGMLKEAAPPVESEVRTLTLVMQADKYEVIMTAIKQVQASEDDEIDKSRGLELICADYLAS